MVELIVHEPRLTPCLSESDTALNSVTSPGLDDGFTYSLFVQFEISFVNSSHAHSQFAAELSQSFTVTEIVSDTGFESG